MKVALIGYGYWGINIARTLGTLSSKYDLHAILDNDPARIDEAAKLYSFKRYDSYAALLKSDIDAVFIATPPHSHYKLAKEALLADKHIFVEKPFTTNLEQAYELFELAGRKNLTSMVDHIFVYAEPVKYLKRIIERFGELVYINARRINLGLFQYTTDVVWDLAVHDLAIIDHLVGLDIKKASIYKKKYKHFPNEAIANIDLELMCDVVVNINVSWLSPVKVREMIIGGTDLTAIYDDTKPEKIHLYEAGVVLKKELNKNELYQQMFEYNYGEKITPTLPSNMSLTNALEHFHTCVREHLEPLSGKDSVFRVIKALEIISKIG